MIQFEVLGPECSRTSRLKASVLAYISDNDLEAEMLWVESSERYHELGLRSTPGLALNGKLLFQACGMSKEGLAKYMAHQVDSSLLTPPFSTDEGESNT